MFFVSAITGHVGGAVASQLLDKGRKVRALIRDGTKAERWLRKGVEIYDGDLTYATALGKAMVGIEGAFNWAEMQVGFNCRWIHFGALGAQSVATTTTAAQLLNLFTNKQRGGACRTRQSALIRCQSAY